jgi:hypothetical protein
VKLKCSDFNSGDTAVSLPVFEVVVQTPVPVIEVEVEATFPIVEDVVHAVVDSEPPRLVDDQRTSFLDDDVNELLNVHTSLGSMGVRDDVQHDDEVIEVCLVSAPYTVLRRNMFVHSAFCCSYVCV